MSVCAGSIKVQSTMIETLADNASRTDDLAVDLGISKVTSYTDGKTAGKVERAYYYEFSAAATPLDVDLSAIVCNDGSVGMDYVREIILSNSATTDGHDLTVGLGTNPFPCDLGGTNPTQLVRAGTTKRLCSRPLGATGVAVSTNVTLRIDPGANTISGILEILGHDA